MTEPEHEQNQSQSEPGAPSEPSHLDHWSPVTEAMRTHGDPRFTRNGNPIDPPDPGSGFSRILATLATIFVVCFVVLWQNTPDATKQQLFYGKVKEEKSHIAADQPAPGSYGSVDIMGRIFLRGLDQFKSHGVMEQIDPAGMMHIPEDRVRLIMISAEFEGTDAALSRLEAFRLESLGLGTDTEADTITDSSSGGDPSTPGTTISISTDDLVLHELDILRRLYTEGADALSEDQSAQLKARYGYIGHVALTHGKPSSDPVRKALTDQFMSLALFLVLVALVILLGPLIGIVLLILGMVWFFSGKLKMRARVPTPGGSVYLETYALFVGCFCLMAVGTFVVSNSRYPEFAAFSLLVQWLLLLTVFWALLRGTSGSDWRQAIGWHTGEGLFKEIGCGIVGYLASVPIYIVGVIITAILLVLKEIWATQANGGVPPEPEPMVNPVFDMIARGDLFILLFLFVLATTWAPIVEESIFRGALYRHLRGRMHWVFSALLTAVLFAFMHDYGPLMVAPLIALGFSFAFMREWRGSIIAPMTAHFIHNFTLMSFMLILVQVIKDPVG